MPSEKSSEKIRRAVFDVAVVDEEANHRMQVRGYVLGDYGTHKNKYNWIFTHLPTGVALSSPWIETVRPALDHLARLTSEGPDEIQQKIIDKHAGQWGLGLVGKRRYK